MPQPEISRRSLKKPWEISRTISSVLLRMAWWTQNVMVQRDFKVCIVKSRPALLDPLGVWGGGQRGVCKFMA